MKPYPSHSVVKLFLLFAAGNYNISGRELTKRSPNAHQTLTKRLNPEYQGSTRFFRVKMRWIGPHQYSLEWAPPNRVFRR